MTDGSWPGFRTITGKLTVYEMNRDLIEAFSRDCRQQMEDDKIAWMTEQLFAHREAELARLLPLWDRKLHGEPIMVFRGNRFVGLGPAGCRDGEFCPVILPATDLEFTVTPPGSV